MMRALMLIAFLYGCFAKKESIRNVFNPDNAQTKRLFEEMGFDKKRVLTKQNFRDFFSRLIYKDNDISSPKKQFNDGILNRYVKDIPEEAPQEEMMRFLNFEKFVTAIEDTVREQFGEKYVFQVTKAILEMEVGEDESAEKSKPIKKEDQKGKSKEKEEKTEL